LLGKQTSRRNGACGFSSRGAVHGDAVTCRKIAGGELVFRRDRIAQYPFFVIERHPLPRAERLERDEHVVGRV
jgi:hypothetical protein